MGSSSVLRRGLLCAFVCPPAGLRHLSAHLFVLFPPTSILPSTVQPTRTRNQDSCLRNRVLDLLCPARSERRRTLCFAVDVPSSPSSALGRLNTSCLPHVVRPFTPVAIRLSHLAAAAGPRLACSVRLAAVALFDNGRAGARGRVDHAWRNGHPPGWPRRAQLPRLYALARGQRRTRASGRRRYGVRVRFEWGRHVWDPPPARSAAAAAATPAPATAFLVLHRPFPLGPCFERSATATAAAVLHGSQPRLPGEWITARPSGAP